MKLQWSECLRVRPRGRMPAALLMAAVLQGGVAVAQETDQQYCERQQGPARVVCMRDLKSAPATTSATTPATAPAPAKPTEAAATTSAPAPAPVAAAAGPAPYKVVDGYHVDAQTLKGFQTWRSAACDRCHGANQEGLVGPSLVNSLKTLSKADFVKTVTNGRLEKGMPSFGASPSVVANIDQLYAYLKGRSDGAITKAHVEAIQ